MPLKLCAVSGAAGKASTAGASLGVDRHQPFVGTLNRYRQSVKFFVVGLFNRHLTISNLLARLRHYE
jgi:hypothetical protein